MARVADLIRDMPPACRHVIDYPWRLSSPAINEGLDAVYWVNAGGQVVGFAAWQLYWAALDVYIAPGPEARVVEGELFAWADGRFRERDAERGRPLPYAAEFRDDDLERRRLVMAHGFLLNEHESYVQLWHPLTDLAPIPPPPLGFALRPLRGEAEGAAYAEAHRAAFESDSMTSAWRTRALRAPQYHSDLDLVISAPDGSIAAFCVGWYEPARRVAQIEPLGVHPRFRRLGLARILLLEMLRRFSARGAESAIVETDLERTAARRAYESVGFRPIHTIVRLEKWADPTR